MSPTFKKRQKQKSEFAHTSEKTPAHPMEASDVTSAFRGARHLWNRQTIWEFQPAFVPSDAILVLPIDANHKGW